MGLGMGKPLITNQSHFATVPQATIPRSIFDRSHGLKTTFDSGYLVPVYVDEALPGDTFNMKMTSFARLQTTVFPIMDNLYVDVFFFAVPIRLIWSNWAKFNGAQTNPGDSTTFLVPTMTSTAGTGYLLNSLHDYFGIPTEVPGLVHNSLHHRAYNLIWNEWFRDQNLQNSVTVDLGDGPDTPGNYVLLRRGKRHDYFTSSLPWTQKGTAVTIPLGTSAPVVTNNTAFKWAGTGGVTESNFQVSSANDQVHRTAGTPGNTETLKWGTVTGLNTDLSTATAATINQLRQSFQIQKLYERDARGGTRYTEIIRAHFGVTSPDARLQRPEFLGGGSTRVTQTPIPQTSATSGSAHKGDLGGVGTFSHNNVGFTKSFTEHCVLLGLVAARADLNYQDGLNRMWSRQTRWDYYWPALATIGEQAVLNKEIWAQGSANPTADAAAFGYQERYAEYRYKPSQITGLFRSNATGTLESWHLAQSFGSLPTLGSTFIQDTPPLGRAVVDSTQPHFLFDAAFTLRCARPMPTYGVPGLIDHF